MACLLLLGVIEPLEWLLSFCANCFSHYGIAAGLPSLLLSSTIRDGTLALYTQLIYLADDWLLVESIRESQTREWCRRAMTLFHPSSYTYTLLVVARSVSNLSMQQIDHGCGCTTKVCFAVFEICLTKYHPRTRRHCQVTKPFSINAWKDFLSRGIYACMQMPVNMPSCFCRTSVCFWGSLPLKVNRT